jgi:hypothetical protein
MKKLTIFLCILLLNACGGGGSSSGGGSENGTPGPTQFAGTYNGQVRGSASADGESAAELFRTQITIAANGRVIITTEDTGEGAVCSTAPPPVFISGNVIPFNLSGTCFLPAIGNCTVSTKGELTVSGNSIIGQTSGTISCASGFKVSIRYEVGVSK